MLRAFVTAILRVIADIFFRRIEIVGWENVTPGAPVIFAVNHPNGLIDGIFLLCYSPRPVSFLAKAPIFSMPLIGWLARSFDSIPVYRKQDNYESSQNRETFARARALLARGGAIAIFPEGTTHSDPKLRELKTGAARIALGSGIAADGSEIVIVPTGIYYTAKKVFRSSALVYFADPIPVRPAAIDEDGEPPREAVEALTASIEAALAQSTLQADSHDALDLIARAERIFTVGREKLASELELRKRFVAGYAWLREHDPARLARLQSSVERFESELGNANLETETLVPPTVAGSVKTIVTLLITLPLAIAGAVVNYPTYRLIGFLANRLTDEESMVATIKAVAGMVLYPLTWIACGAIVWWRFGVVDGLLTVLVLPLLGYVALRFFERLDDVIGRTRALTWRVARRRAFARLLAQRDAIHDEIVALNDVISLSFRAAGDP